MGHAARSRFGRRLAQAVCVLAGVAATSAACSAGDTDQPAATSPTPDAAIELDVATTPGRASPAASDAADPTDDGAPSTPATDLSNLVIVTFSVDWQPEPELSASEVSAQRDRIERAQQAALDALGPDGRLVRELHATAQASLSVSDDGLARLDALPEIAAVDVDTPDPPDPTDAG